MDLFSGRLKIRGPHSVALMEILFLISLMRDVSSRDLLMKDVLETVYATD
jgi:hypothetical protein